MKTLRDIIDEIIDFNQQQLEAGKIDAVEQSWLRIRDKLDAVKLPFWYRVLDCLLSDRTAYIFCGLCLFTAFLLLLRQ